jgi:endonuclease/exonuclease/phosphatase family metal-dependent hydrolase
MLRLLTALYSIYTLYSTGSFAKSLTAGPIATGPKTSITLMQYNAEWLFLDHYDTFDCPGTQCTWANLSQAETHMSYVSDVVALLSPDILNVCEVEGVNELNQLANQSASGGGHKLDPYFVQGTDTATGQNVGMLSNIVPKVMPYRVEARATYPIEGSKCGYTGPPGDTGVSKHYITELDLFGHSVMMISAHLIAIPTDAERCAKREAQAVVLQSIVDVYQADQPDLEFILMGDFNDYDSEVSDRNGNVPTSKVLSILKGIDGPTPYAEPLVNLASMVDAPERYTDWWNSDGDCATNDPEHDLSLIDHILVSPSLAKHVAKVFVYHGYPEYCGKYDSDHYPLVVQFDFAM